VDDIMPGQINRIFLFALLSLSTLGVHAAIDVHTFDSETQRERYQHFIEEMRCPKCQNQNLAGSDSPISSDLRRELFEMIRDGQSDKEIVDFMVARYGDFILYRPRVQPSTYVLWIAPLALLLFGFIVLLVMLRKRKRITQSAESVALSDDEEKRLQTLLKNNSEKRIVKNNKENNE
jgi:cytochrome c-type biogenesis protein CcmH